MKLLNDLCMDDRHHRCAQLGTDRCDRLESGRSALWHRFSAITRIVYLAGRAQRAVSDLSVSEDRQP